MDLQAEPVCDPLYEPGCELAVEFYPVLAELLVLSLCSLCLCWVLSLQVDEVVQFEGRVVGAESAHDGKRSCGRWLARIRHADELHPVLSPLLAGERERCTQSRRRIRGASASECHLSPSEPVEQEGSRLQRDGARLLTRHHCVPLLGQPASVPPSPPCSAAPPAHPHTHTHTHMQPSRASSPT